MITRPDRIRVGQIGPHIIPTEAQKKAVEDIAKENHDISNDVFEAIKSENDIDNMMAHLKGEDEES